MTSYTRVHMVLLALILSALGYAQNSAPSDALPEVASIQPQAQVELREDKQVLRGQLANGLTYLIRPTAEPKGRMSVRLHVDVGSTDEDENTSGISHFLEHLMFNGSRNFKRGELIPAMQKMGVGFGGDANAYTGIVETVYMLNLPNLQDETVKFALTVMRDFADGATLEDEAIDKERGIIVSELKSRDSESYRAMIANLSQLTEGTKMASYLPIGKEEVIRNAPYETFRNYYRTHYVPERMTVILTGDFPADKGKAWVEEYFGSMEPVKPAPRPSVGELNATSRTVKIIANPEAALSTVTIAIANPWVKRPDTLQQIIDDLPLQLACGMVNERFERMSKQEGSPFNAANASESDMSTASTVFSLSATAKPENWKAALNTLEQETRRAAQYGFSAAELTEISARIKVSYESQIAAWPDVSAADMANELVGICAQKNKALTPAEQYRAFKIALERVMADPDLCRQALAKAYDTERTKLNIVGTIAEDANEESLSAAYAASLATDVAAPEVKEQKPFAYDNIGEPGKIIALNTIDELGITALTLSNGIRVNIKPIDFQKGYLSISAAIDGGDMAMPADKPGLSALLGLVMGLDGLEEHSKDELRSLLAPYRVGVGFGIDETRFIFRGTTRIEDFEMQCKLLAASIMHPGFRGEGELRFRRELPSAYTRLHKTPQGAFQMQGMRALFDDARFITPQQEEQEARTTAEAKDFITPYLKDGAMEVSIVGDFKLEDILPVLERTIAAMPARKAAFTPITDEQRQVKFKEWGQRHFLRYPTELDKTIVTQVRFAGNGHDLRRNRRLGILREITREKLFDGIRANLGEAYSPRVSVTTNADYTDAALFICSSEGVKRNRTKVSSAMDLILDDLGRGNITEEDFERAIKPALSRIEKAKRTPDYWEGITNNLQSEPVRLAHALDYERDMKSITLEEIKQVATEVFGPAGKTSYLFTVPEDEADGSKASEEKPADAPAERPAQPLEAAALPFDLGPVANTAGPDSQLLSEGNCLAICISKTTAALPEWKQVADNLLNQTKGAQLLILDDLNNCAAALRGVNARYAAFVAQPGEIDYILVNNIHRATRQIDDDPWGDCIWGIITGYTAADALRIAKARTPLHIKRVLATTNVDAGRMEHSCCITDWQPNQLMQQSGYNKAEETLFTADSPEGEAAIEGGMQQYFATYRSHRCRLHQC